MKLPPGHTIPGIRDALGHVTITGNTADVLVRVHSPFTISGAEMPATPPQALPAP